MNDETSERLAELRREMARQDDEFRVAMSALAALGDGPRAVPGGYVERLDALAGDEIAFGPAMRA